MAGGGDKIDRVRFLVNGLTVGALLASAAISFAGTGTKPRRSSFTDASLSIATTVWGQPHCGQPRLEWVDISPDLGQADRNRCVIELNSAERKPGGWLSSREMQCSVIVHEWGHLAGQQHSPDPKNIMHNPILRIYWRCDRPPITRWYTWAGPHRR